MFPSPQSLMTIRSAQEQNEVFITTYAFIFQHITNQDLPSLESYLKASTDRFYSLRQM